MDQGRVVLTLTEDKVMQKIARTIRPETGFTIVEMVVVVLVVSLAIGVGLGITSNTGTVASPTLSGRLFLQMEGRKLADNILESIRRSSDIIRPGIGETTPFLLVRDAENQVCYYYLTVDSQNSQKYGKSLFKLVAFTHTYEKKNDGLKTFGNSIESLNFTGVSPNCVQLNLKISADKDEFQFVSQAGVMSLGDSEI